MEIQLNSIVGQEQEVLYKVKGKGKKQSKMITLKRFVSPMTSVVGVYRYYDHKHISTSQKLFFVKTDYSKVYVNIFENNTQDNWFARLMNVPDTDVYSIRFLRLPELDAFMCDSDPKQVLEMFQTMDEIFIQYKIDDNNYRIENAMTGEVVKQTPNFKPKFNLESAVNIELKDFIENYLSKTLVNRTNRYNRLLDAKGNEELLMKMGFKRRRTPYEVALAQGDEFVYDWSAYRGTIIELERPIEIAMAEYKENLVDKAYGVLNNYKPTDFKAIYVRKGRQGIEGIFDIGEGRTAHLWSIVAGGHSIQVLHYRYFVHVTKSKEEIEAIRLKIQLNHDAEMALEETQN